MRFATVTVQYFTDQKSNFETDPLRNRNLMQLLKYNGQMLTFCCTSNKSSQRLLNPSELLQIRLTDIHTMRVTVIQSAVDQ